MKKQGVTPAHEIDFAICTSGRPDDLKTGTYVTIKDTEGMPMSYDSTTEEWYPMDQHGWRKAAVTGKALSISFTGKRNYGDEGNDYVAGKFMAMGAEAESAIRIIFPNGDKFYMPCVLNVTSMGGETTALGSLEWEALSDGRPEYVEAYTEAE